MCWCFAFFLLTPLAVLFLSSSLILLHREGRCTDKGTERPLPWTKVAVQPSGDGVLSAEVVRWNDEKLCKQTNPTRIKPNTVY